MWKWIKRLLLFVVIVIAVLVGYVFMHDRVTGPPPAMANMSDLRSLNTALKTYKTTYGHYPDSLAQLGVSRSGPASEQAAGLLGAKLASGTVHAYTYTYAKTASGYEVHADPATADTNVHLYTDESAEIRMQRKKPAGKESQIAQ